MFYLDLFDMEKSKFILKGKILIISSKNFEDRLKVVLII